MLKYLTSIKTLMFASIASLGFSVTGCDFGNKANDTATTVTQPGSMQQRGNLTDTIGTDTAAINSRMY